MSGENNAKKQTISENMIIGKPFYLQYFSIKLYSVPIINKVNRLKYFFTQCTTYIFFYKCLFSYNFPHEKNTGKNNIIYEVTKFVD